MPLCSFHVRVSHRAKRMQLKVSPSGEVEVVLPKHVSQKHVAPFVAQHQEWITQTQQQMRELYPPETRLPDTLRLDAIDREWELQYFDGKRARVVEQSSILNIYSRDDEAARKALRRWLNRHAGETLIPWLHAVSEELNLPYNHAVIRAQKTRWGSCSSSGTISLNRALLFMPPKTVRYLMIHELCHTKHMNHSLRYWALVEHYIPDYREHELRLNRGFRAIPRWALAV